MAVRDSLIAFMAATAQAQAEATKEAQRAAIAQLKAKDDGSYKGRKPSYTREQFSQVVELDGKGASVSEIAKTTGLSRQSIYRIKGDPAAAEKAVACGVDDYDERPLLTSTFLSLQSVQNFQDEIADLLGARQFAIETWCVLSRCLYDFSRGNDD